MTLDTENRPEAKPELILANWRSELDGADLYNYLASREADPQRSLLLREMADAETRHAKVMERGLQHLGVRVPAHRVSLKTRILKTLAGVFGAKIVYPVLQGVEIAGVADYASQDATTASLASEERSHARTMGQIAGAGSLPQGAGAAERWHRSGGGGSLRAAIFGVSDGLVSNLSLVMGFAGAAAGSNVVLLAGLSGLLAGASSMAAGEYVSMKAQRELFERQIQLEASELLVTPQEEEEELALIYRAKGIPKAEAERLAARLAHNPEVALDTLVREELGLDPKQLGSPMGAAASSFVSFAVGALLPVLPYFFGAAALNVGLSLLLSAVGLFSIGAMLSIFTGRDILFSGARQLLIGAAAAALTFALGTALGGLTGV